MPSSAKTVLDSLLQRLRALGPRQGGAVTALALGTSCLAVRVEPGEGGKPRITAALEGPPEQLASWKKDKVFADSRTVLVLTQDQRQLLALERPEVPDAELTMALRFPLAEALEQEPDQVLAATVSLPRISEAPRTQVLAIGTALAPLQAQLATAAQAGIAVRAVDVVDTALRGMALLQARQNDGSEDANGQVVLAFIGRSIAIGLLWRGEYCALRSLPLPVREPRDAAEFEEHLALHIQRTTDQFERQATQLAVRQVLAAMPSLHPEVRESVRGSLPLTPTLFEITQAFEIAPALAETLRSHNDLHALACVAAARLIDAQAATQAQTVELFDADRLIAKRDHSLALAAAVMALGAGAIGAYGYSLQEQLRQVAAQRATLAAQLQQAAPKALLTPALLEDLQRQLEGLEAPLRGLQVSLRDDGQGLQRASSWLDRLATLAGSEISLQKVDIERNGSARLEGLAASPAALSAYVQALTRLDPATPVQARAIEVRQEKTPVTHWRFVMRVNAPGATPPAAEPQPPATTAAASAAMQVAQGKP